MPRIRFIQLLAGTCAAFSIAATAQATASEALLLLEPIWLLQDEGGRETVWFEQGPEGLVMVRCAHGAACRQIVRADEKGLTMGARGAGALSLGRGSGNVPYFADTGATVVLMPAWVVPAAGARVGH